MLLQKVVLGGLEYDVEILDHRDKRLEGNVGIVYHEKGKIYLSSALRGQAFLDTYVHEVFGHALLHATGVRHFLWYLSGEVDPAAEAAVEETFVRLYSPALKNALIAAGWTPPPKIIKRTETP
jgi:hypothetical protein